MTTRRPYRLRKRAESSAATRRRIVEATMAVHDRQGITATSVRDVARAAGVAPATVLRHFPAMADLIEACGRLTDELYPMPTETVLSEATDRWDGVRRVALAFFEWWGHDPSGWTLLQVDRLKLPQVDGWLRNVEIRRRSLLQLAMGEGTSAEEIAVVTALTSHGAWLALREAGMSPQEAASQVARYAEKGSESGWSS